MGLGQEKGMYIAFSNELELVSFEMYQHKDNKL